MADNTSYSPKKPTKYLGPSVNPSSVVTRNRQPTGADYRQPETGKLYPVSSFWLIGNDPTTGIAGELWYLSKIVSNVAFWVQLSSGSSLQSTRVDSTSGTGVNPVLPDGNGETRVTGSLVAAGTSPISTNSPSPNEYEIQVQTSQALVAADSTKVGLCNFDSSQFTVNSDGFVSFLGSGAVLQATVTLTSPQIKALNATPIQLVPAPGAGKINVVTNAWVKFNYAGSNVFTAGAGQVIDLYYGTTIPSIQALLSNIILTGTATLYNNVLISAKTNIAPADLENQPIMMYNPLAEISGNAANDNTATFTCTYYVFEI